MKEKIKRFNKIAKLEENGRENKREWWDEECVEEKKRVKRDLKK